MRRLFLLGGHDLEMEEIRKLFEVYGYEFYKKEKKGKCFFVDRSLTWGAKLSDYDDLLDFDGEIYGIELTEDIIPPENYHAIDHHGKHWYRLSALEQVANLLGTKLTRWQQLVAANDKGHIAALQAMGATPEEIEEIREADMKAQGITEEEKRHAYKEAKTLQKRDGFYYKETTLKHTTPLVDLLVKAGKTPLVVVNKERKNLTYFGDRILKLVETFRMAIDAQTAYYGGNPLGYFGFTPKYFNDHSIEETLETITETLQNDSVHSYHIFMFPFRVKSFTDHNFITEKNEHEKLLAEEWETKPFTIESTQNYNEFVYFYKYVRDELYQTEAFDPNQTSRYYVRKELDNATWTMQIHGERFSLELDGVALRLFRTGIGILSINLVNRETDDNEKILLINEFGRRIYPQFLAGSDGCDYAFETKNAFLPQSVAIILANGELLVKEEFLYTKFPTTKKAPKIGAHIRKLLGENLADLADPVIDDRMYTLGYINKDGRGLGLDKKGYLKEESPSDFWYRYIFLDGSEITCHSPEMKKELIQKATYDRWMNHPSGCSLYGVTRYSFMFYSSYELLHIHLRTMYYQMAVLVLAQRASILRYADEVTKLLTQGRDKIDIRRSTELYYDYIVFVNRLHFREVTPQEQGIELYDMMQRQMRIEREFKELDAEIAELHNYIDMRSEKSRNDRLETISKLGAVFLPPTLLAGMFGMNFIDFDQHNALYATIAISMILLSGVMGYMIMSIKKNAIRIIATIMLFALMGAAVLGYPYPNRNDKKPSRLFGLYTYPTTKDANATNK